MEKLDQERLMTTGKDLYKSKFGEIRTYDDWYLWVVEFYMEMEPQTTLKDIPKDWWPKLVRILELEKVDD